MVQHSRNAGFTLIELMVVMAVVLVLLGAGMGMSSDYVARRHLERGAGTMLESLRNAQMAAVFKRQTIVVEFLGNSYRCGKNDGSEGFYDWVPLTGGVTYSLAGFVPSGLGKTLTYDAFGVPTPGPSGGGVITLSLGKHSTSVDVSSITGRVVATPIS